MASQAYERLNPVAFGHHAITTGDLDPVYCALSEMPLSEAQRNRWLIAYWCFYHCGFASYASEAEGEDFWKVMLEAGRNETASPAGGRWPRGSERRHFRGKQAEAALQELMARYGSDTCGMVDTILGEPSDEIPFDPIPFKTIADRVKTHRGFGPWIAFKVADMVDRVVRQPVEFNDAAVFMFKDPVKGAGLVARWVALGEPETFDPQDVLVALDEPVTEGDIHVAVTYLQEKLGHLQAPPHADRVINLQEVETVLCKWKSHLRGHYPLYNDIDEILHGLDPKWGRTAADFHQAMPKREN